MIALDSGFCLGWLWRRLWMRDTERPEPEPRERDVDIAMLVSEPWPLVILTSDTSDTQPHAAGAIQAENIIETIL